MSMVNLQYDMYTVQGKFKHLSPSIGISVFQYKYP